MVDFVIELFIAVLVHGQASYSHKNNAVPFVGKFFRHFKCTQ